MVRLEDRQRRLMFLVLLGLAWFATRYYLLAGLGIFHGQTGGVQFQDVNSYNSWWQTIRTGHLPTTDNAWQYPPGAALIMAIPALLNHNYYFGFVTMALLVDFMLTAVLLVKSWRSNRWIGSAYWIFLIPLLSTLSITRFDIVPTALAALACTLVAWPVAAGALIGLGTYIKIWPILCLFAMKSLRDIRRAAIACVFVLIVGSLLSKGILHSFTGGFLANQSDRGLEIEAVAASIWYLVAGAKDGNVHYVGGFGSLQFTGSVATLLSHLLDMVWIIAAIISVIGCINLCRKGRWSRSLGLDVVWTLTLMFIVTSKVLSPQYLIWLIGLGAVVLGLGETRLARPMIIATAAIIMTVGLYNNVGSLSVIAIRNFTLLVALIDAVIQLARASRPQKSLDPVQDLRIEDADVTLSRSRYQPLLRLSRRRSEI